LLLSRSFDALSELGGGCIRAVPFKGTRESRRGVTVV
jgi:hypothetical protein